MKKIYKDLIIHAIFWSCLLCALTYPSIHGYVIKDIDIRLISLNQILPCLSSIIINLLWNKMSDRIIKIFPMLLFTEGIINIIIISMMALNIISTMLYYICDILLFCIVTRNIMCATNKIKSIKYDGSARELFDNNSQIASSIGTLIGGTISLIIPIPIGIALIISCVGPMIDNVFYLIEYIRIKRRASE